jgi:hypothetical protein
MTNQLSNPSVEVNDTSMYSAVGSASLVRASSGAAPDGSFVAQVTSGASGNVTVNTLTVVAANPGEIWSAGVKARFLAGTIRNIRTDIQWLDAGAAVISSALGSATAIDGATFTQYKVEGATAPALTVGVRVRIIYVSAVAVDAYEADCFQLEQGATLPAFNPATDPTYDAYLLESGSGAILLEDGTPVLTQ